MLSGLFDANIGFGARIRVRVRVGVRIRVRCRVRRAQPTVKITTRVVVLVSLTVMS